VDKDVYLCSVKRSYTRQWVFTAKHSLDRVYGDHPLVCGRLTDALANPSKQCSLEMEVMRLRTNIPHRYAIYED
jgi:hypothetical protein